MKLFLLLVFTSVTMMAGVKIKSHSKGILSGERVEYSTGKVKLFLKKSDTNSINLPVNDVVYVEQPKPDLVKFLQKAFEDGKHDAIAQKGAVILGQNYETGWGKKCAFFYIISLIEEKKLAEAEKVIKKAKIQIPGIENSEDNKLISLAEKYLQYAKKDQVKLANLKTPESPLGKFYFYKLEGQLFEADMKDSLAVISYYKSLLLGAKMAESAKVQKLIENIYKEQGDPRKLPDLSKI